MSSPDTKPTVSCHVVAMSYPGRGHINPMLNLCNAVAQRSGDIFITFVVTEEWLGFIGSVKKPPNISFATIPNVVPSELVRGDDIHAFVVAVMTKMEEPFDRLLDELRLPQPAVIIADALLSWTADVAARRNIPLAYLWPMSASVYTAFYHFDLLVQNGHFPIDLPVNGDETVDYIPGLSPIRVTDLPTILRDQEITLKFLEILPRLDSKAKYLIFSSIYELETHVFNALKQISAVSIYNVGPADSYSKLKDIIHSYEDDDGSDEYTKWLDLQPPDSVLYVSLGSYLSASRSQMDEISTGLCSSGVKFLWVVRGREASRMQEMCGDKGMVVGWCDQLRVLVHPSVGGFWSHCGWNSTKEAVLAGVPVLASPIMVDQLTNAKTIVEDWRLGWRVLKGVFDEKELVKGNEIGKLVQRFMNLESEERKELTRNARALKKICEKEFASGQSFETNLDGFVESVLENSAAMWAI